MPAARDRDRKKMGSGHMEVHLFRSTDHSSPDEFISMMFDICRTEDGKASVSVFLEEIRRTGLRVSDPRLRNMLRMLNNLKPHGLSSVEDLKLDAHTFKAVLNENMVLITKAMQNQLIIPGFEVPTYIV